MPFARADEAEVAWLDPISSREGRVWVHPALGRALLLLNPFEEVHVDHLRSIPWAQVRAVASVAPPEGQMLYEHLDKLRTGSKDEWLRWDGIWGASGRREYLGNTCSSE